MKYLSKAMILAGFIFVFTAICYMSLLAGSKQEKNKKASDDSVDVYVTGKRILNGMNHPTSGYWKNGKWITVTKNEGPSIVKSIFINGEDVYSIVYFLDDEINYPPCYYKNGKKIILFRPKNIYRASTSFITVFENNIIVVGTCYSHEGETVEGYWKNNEWFSMSNLSLYKETMVNSFYMSYGDVYAGGYLIDKSEKWFPCYWINSKIIFLESLDRKEKSWVTSLFVIGDDVYAGGISEYRKDTFSSSAPVFWKNGKLVKLSKLNENAQLAAVNAITMYKGDLYIAGSLRTKNGLSGINIGGYWKNEEWISLTPVDAQYGSAVHSICVYNGDVYAAGINAVGTGKDIPGYWKNGEWIPFEGDPTFATVTSIVVVPRNEEAK